jgi:uroporphyrin-III C-methyltransferase
MGKVFLVGAGPGDPELLTCKALRILQSAGIVLHDSLVGEEIISLTPPGAERIDVGKRRGYKLLTQQDINSLLIAAAAKYEVVVRLKGGDPLLFGRAAEEIQVLHEAAVEFEIVPGISAAFGAAAAARVPLTDRALASNVLFTTFSRSPEAQQLLRSSLTSDTTVVVYMPGAHYADVSNWLLQAGLSPETPCLIVSKATLPDQITKLSTAAALANLPPLPAPALLIVGRTVDPHCALSGALSWRDAPAAESRRYVGTAFLPRAAMGRSGPSPIREASRFGVGDSSAIESTKRKPQ